MAAPAYRLEDSALLTQCAVERFRAGGPGGQHLNRTESAVRLVHRATGVDAQCQDHRSRERNVADALKRLRLRLALHDPAGADPSWIDAYRQGRRLAISANGREYAAAVAVCLAALSAQKGSLPEAAADLKLSSSQIAKLLTADKEVRQEADRIRQAHGLSAMRG